MSKSVFLDDLLALGSLSAARPSANEDDPLPGHVESRIEDHVDGAAGFVEDLHLLALGGDLGQLAPGLVGLDHGLRGLVECDETLLDGFGVVSLNFCRKPQKISSS